MASKKILTIFGATGRQGGSAINTVLSRSELSSKYALRGVTRNTSSEKAQALASKGVELVTGDVDDVATIREAIRGSYGVFGVTDFWNHLDDAREIQQGKNIYEACQAEGITHLVFSSLPNTKELTNGKLTHIRHFDSKAAVEAHIRGSRKDGLIVTYFHPTMFVDFLKQGIRDFNGTPTLAMPFPSGDINWPLIDADRDSGKYVIGIFEAGKAADGAVVHGVSTWTTPNKVVAAFSKESGQDVKFFPAPADVFKSFLPPNIADELLETLLLIGNYEYYGPGAKEEQAKHDKWLIKDADLIDFPTWVHENRPWKF